MSDKLTEKRGGNGNRTQKAHWISIKAAEHMKGIFQ